MRGEYQHTVDSKGRLTFPVKLREELGETFVISRGLDKCIWVFKTDEWEEFESKIKAIPVSRGRRLQRYFAANFDCAPDQQGRVLIPPVLRNHANITKDVTLVVVANRLEMWDTDEWNSYNGTMSNDDVADDMSDLGL